MIEDLTQVFGTSAITPLFREDPIGNITVTGERQLGIVGQISNWIKDNIVTPVNNFINDPLGTVQSVLNEIFSPESSSILNIIRLWLHNNIYIPIVEDLEGIFGITKAETGSSYVDTYVKSERQPDVVGQISRWIRDSIITPANNFISDPLGTIQSVLDEIFAPDSSGLLNTIRLWLHNNIYIPFVQDLESIFEAASTETGSSYVDTYVKPNREPGVIGQIVNWIRDNIVIPVGGFLIRSNRKH